MVVGYTVLGSLLLGTVLMGFITPNLLLALSVTKRGNIYRQWVNAHVGAVPLWSCSLIHNGWVWMWDFWVSPETRLQRAFVKNRRVAVTRKGLSIHWVCFFVPVEGSACGHAPGKAFHALLSEEGDGGEIGGHDSQRVRRVHKEAVFTEDHVPVLKDTTFSFWIWMANR